MLFILIQDELVSPKIEDILPADFRKTSYQCTKPLHLDSQLLEIWSFQFLRMIMRRAGCKSRKRRNVSGCRIAARPNKGILGLQIRHEGVETDLKQTKKSICALSKIYFYWL